MSVMKNFVTIVNGLYPPSHRQLLQNGEEVKNLLERFKNFDFGRGVVSSSRGGSENFGEKWKAA